MRILRNIKETELIQLLQGYITSSSHMGSNEDAYLIKDQLPFLLVNIDSMQRDSDFLPHQTWDQIGGKLVTMTFSDLVAKGATPEYFLTSLILEENMNEEELKHLVESISKTTNKYGAEYIGGDLGTAKETVLSGIGTGSIFEGKILTRRGAQAEDLVCVTGHFGLPSIGFNHLLEKNTEIIPKISSELLEEALLAVYEPKLRMKEGFLLSSNELASSSIDSSDGLAASLNWLSKESKTKIIIDTLPIDPRLLNVVTTIDNRKTVTFFGGEEFEIVFTVPPSKLDRTHNLFEKEKKEFMVIGHCEKGSGVYFKQNSHLERIPFFGWDSLKKKPQ
ncbi:MAG: thiamine-phosphate kinase [Candidatus Hodarchaeales archaeon]|jgi:thiamine-monophosphate kinase